MSAGTKTDPAARAAAVAGDVAEALPAAGESERRITNDGSVSRESLARPAEVLIRPTSGWRTLDIAELFAYRDLFRFLTWRGIKVRYAQSAIGVGWAVIQPLFTMLVFSLVFGTLAGVSSDGVPYKLFSLAALVPWTYFQNALNDCSQSLVTNANMISKVYFPRLILPLSAVTGKLVDFAIAMCVLGLLIAWFHFVPEASSLKANDGPPSMSQAPAATGLANIGRLIGLDDTSSAGALHQSGFGLPDGRAPWRFVISGRLLALPALSLVMVLTAAGLGAWLTALAIQYRDVKHAMAFVVQLLMFASPVVYPTSAVPEQYDFHGWVINLQQVYALNPLVGVIEGFRAALLGTRSMPWDLIAIGSVSAVVIALTGAVYFRSRERLFADVA